MTLPETKPQSSPNPPKSDDAIVPSQGPLKNEPTPERAQEEKKEHPQGWEQKKSGAV